eukprot:gene12998-biopygen12523
MLAHGGSGGSERSSPNRAVCTDSLTRICHIPERGSFLCPLSGQAPSKLLGGLPARSSPGRNGCARVRSASGPRLFLQILSCAPRPVRVRCRFPLFGQSVEGAPVSPNLKNRCHLARGRALCRLPPLQTISCGGKRRHGRAARALLLRPLPCRRQARHTAVGEDEEEVPYRPPLEIHLYCPPPLPPAVCKVRAALPAAIAVVRVKTPPNQTLSPGRNGCARVRSASGPRLFLQILSCAPRPVRVRCRFPLRDIKVHHWVGGGGTMHLSICSRMFTERRLSFFHPPLDHPLDAPLGPPEGARRCLFTHTGRNGSGRGPDADLDAGRTIKSKGTGADRARTGRGRGRFSQPACNGASPVSGSIQIYRVLRLSHRPESIQLYKSVGDCLRLAAPLTLGFLAGGGVNVTPREKRRCRVRSASVSLNPIVRPASGPRPLPFLPGGAGTVPRLVFHDGTMAAVASAPSHCEWLSAQSPPPWCQGGGSESVHRTGNPEPPGSASRGPRGPGAGSARLQKDRDPIVPKRGRARPGPAGPLREQQGTGAQGNRRAGGQPRPRTIAGDGLGRHGQRCGTPGPPDPPSGQIAGAGQPGHKAGRQGPAPLGERTASGLSTGGRAHNRPARDTGGPAPAKPGGGESGGRGRARTATQAALPPSPGDRRPSGEHTLARTGRDHPDRADAPNPAATGPRTGPAPARIRSSA